MSSERRPVVVITGGTGGIGYHSALGVAQAGARVVITGRNLARGEAARQRLMAASGNDAIELVIGDLSSIAGIDALAEALLRRLDRVDVLVNNAGYLGSVLVKSEDGLEMHFAVNVLAPRRLTLSLLPALCAAPSARVLNVTGGDKPGAVDVDNLQAEKGFKGLMTYTHSKSVMEAMSVGLALELAPQSVMVNVVFPGRASTAMTRSLSLSTLPGAMKLMLPVFKLFFAEDGGKSAARAARSTIWGVTTPDLEGVSGCYFDTNSEEKRMHATAYDAAVQARIVSLISAAGG